MKRILTASMLCVISAGTALAESPAPTGVWRVEDGSADIRIVNCSGALWGITAWSKEPASKDDKDKNNPDPALRNRPLMGLPILINMKPSEESWAGQVYNPMDGRTWDAQISLVSKDVLRIEGCLGGFCFGIGAQDWTRQLLPKGAPTEQAICAKMPK